MRPGGIPSGRFRFLAGKQTGRLRLAVILRDWEDAADGKPLDLVYGSVGLLFEDVCRALDIQVEELQSHVRIR